MLETVRSMKDEGTAFQSLGVDGWLGAVAARRGDLETAHAIDSTLAGLDGPQPRGWPAHYRAAIAAWLGHRDQAMELLSQSRAHPTLKAERPRSTQVNRPCTMAAR